MRQTVRVNNQAYLRGVVSPAGEEVADLMKV